MNLLSIIIKSKYIFYSKLAEIAPHPAELPRELLDLRTKLKNSEIL